MEAGRSAGLLGKDPCAYLLDSTVMKRYMLIAALLGFAGAASAQTQPILDHGYSTHNYKHPNKAAVAMKKKLAESGTSSIQRDGSVRENIGLQSTANYKIQRPYSTAGKLNFPASPVNNYVTTDPSQSPRNYKTGVPMGSAAAQTATKKDTSKVSVGD